MWCAFDVTPISSSGQNVIQIPLIARAAALSAMLAFCSQALAQSDDADPEMRIQQLENQLRQLTGQNEELQHANRLLEDRLRALQGGAQVSPGGQPRSPSRAWPRHLRCR